MSSTDTLEKYTRYALTGGEDTLVSPTAQNQETARRVLGLVPTPSGDIEREQVHPKFLPAQLTGGRVGWLEQFNWFDVASKTFKRFFFAATASHLYKQKLGTDVDWVELNTLFQSRTLAISDFPVSGQINNVFHFSDGAGAWIFDGANVYDDGLPIPLEAPSVFPTAGAGSPDLISANRFYWTTFVDKGLSNDDGDAESTISPQSAGTGVIHNSGSINIIQHAGTVTTSTASPNVVGVGTVFTKLAVGWKFYCNGIFQGVIQSITNNLALVLTANAVGNSSGVRYTSAPARANNWYIYASEGDTSAVGVLLARIPLTTQLYTDNSAFPGATPDNYANKDISFPLRNDPPLPTKVMAVHKERIFRRRETQPNFFNYTGNEEVEVGVPSDTVPGTDANTESDLINETSGPDEADAIRLLISHGDALYLGTEDDIEPLFGESYTDFNLSQLVAFRTGAAGRRASVSTKYGLVFGTYDRDIQLYPSFQGSQEATGSLTELSTPIRKQLEQIKASDIDNWNIVHYSWGRRDWLVTCFQKNDSTFHTWVYDFEVQGWFELQLGVSALAVFKTADGNKVLLGGGTDGFVYVLDDLTGTYTVTGNYPAGIYRTPLLDFGVPNGDHIIYAVEFELSDPSMPVVVNVYLDPADPDNPTGAITLLMTPTQIGKNRYRGFIKGNTGGTCHRAMIELQVPAGAVNGRIQGLAVYANAVPPFGVK